MYMMVFPFLFSVEIVSKTMITTYETGNLKTNDDSQTCCRGSLGIWYPLAPTSTACADPAATALAVGTYEYMYMETLTSTWYEKTRKTKEQ